MSAHGVANVTRCTRASPREVNASSGSRSATPLSWTASASAVPNAVLPPWKPKEAMISNERCEKGCKTKRATLGSGCGKRVTTTTTRSDVWCPRQGCYNLQRLLLLLLELFLFLFLLVVLVLFLTLLLFLLFLLLLFLLLLSYSCLYSCSYSYPDYFPDSGSDSYSDYRQEKFNTSSNTTNFSTTATTTPTPTTTTTSTTSTANTHHSFHHVIILHARQRSVITYPETCSCPSKYQRPYDIPVKHVKNK